MSEYIGPFMVGFFVGSAITFLVAMIAGFVHFYGKTIGDQLEIYKPEQKENKNGRKQKRPRKKTRAKNQ